MEYLKLNGKSLDILEHSQNSTAKFMQVCPSSCRLYQFSNRNKSFKSTDGPACSKYNPKLAKSYCFRVLSYSSTLYLTKVSLFKARSYFLSYHNLLLFTCSIVQYVIVRALFLYCRVFQQCLMKYYAACTPCHYGPCKTLGSLTIAAHSNLTLTFSLHPLTPKVIPHVVEPSYYVTESLKNLK